MPIYIGTKQVKLYLNGQKYKIAENVFNYEIPDNVLISSDQKYLKDKNGVYLTCLLEPKFLAKLLSKDNRILLDANNNILMVAEYDINSN